MAADEFLFVDLVGDRKLLRDMDQLPDDIRRLLIEKVRGWAEQLRDLVEDNIRARLFEKTGRLSQSVEVEILEEGLRIEGRVYIAGVPYARAQEKGATMPAHIIRPLDARALAFLAATGDKVFATRVFHPGGIIPPTHFMRDAYRVMSPKVTAGLRRQIIDRINRKVRGR